MRAQTSAVRQGPVVRMRAQAVPERRLVAPRQAPAERLPGPIAQGRAPEARDREAVAEQWQLVRLREPMGRWRGSVARLPEPALPSRYVRRASMRRKHRQAAGQVAWAESLGTVTEAAVVDPQLALQALCPAPS